MKIEDLQREQKVDFLQKIMNGEMVIRKGVFMPNNAMVVISSNGKFFTDSSMLTEIPIELLEDYPGNLVILPHNQR